MTDEEINALASQLAAALAAPISAMIQAQHAPLVAEIKRRQSNGNNNGNRPMSKKQFQALFMTGSSLFGNNRSGNKMNQL
jgi:porphobilinogen deaminase